MSPRRSAGAWWWRLLACLLACLMGALALPATAQEPLPVPALSGRVIDQTGTLDAKAQAALEAKLAAFEAQAGPQIVVLLVQSTQPDDIAAYAQRVADHWKIGRRDVGDGLLLVVAKGDRRVRIEVAKALEGAVPDLAARQIIEQQIRPRFRDNDYAGGLDAAVQGLMALIRGEALPAPAPAAPEPGGGLRLDGEGISILIAATLVLGNVLTRVFGRGLGSLAVGAGVGGIAWWLGASLMLAGAAALAAMLAVAVVSLGSGRGRSWRSSGGGGWSDGGGWGGSSWGGGGSGGDGFSSGGGGDFGGGGASGDW